MAEKIKVALVDDHRIVRRSLHSFLKTFGDLELVGEASSGEEALAHIEEWLPDVLIVDLLMPGGIDGIETTRRVRALSPHTSIVVLTSYSDDARVLGALRAGAIGYVRKEADPDILLSAVRAAARGQSFLDQAVAPVLLQELTRGNGRSSMELTEREQEVLRQISLGRTNREIAEALSVSDETIKTHVGNILTKLHLTHRVQAVIYALKKGVISLDEINLP